MQAFQISNSYLMVIKQSECVKTVLNPSTIDKKSHFWGIIGYRMPHGLKNLLVTALEQAGTPKGGLAADLAALMHIMMATSAEFMYLHQLHSCENTLISLGIKYQYSEIALINMERV